MDPLATNLDVVGPVHNREVVLCLCAPKCLIDGWSKEERISEAKRERCRAVNRANPRVRVQQLIRATRTNLTTVSEVSLVQHSRRYSREEVRIDSLDLA